MSGHFDLGPGAPCDLDSLVDTRLLVQANSGGGKSWALRRILEQTHGKIQQLIIDPEGEFATLRERGDYVLAARQGGDTIAEPRSAKLLAERLLELRVSAILDIYELKAHDRIRFVRYFLEALVDAPKKLWHPVLVVVDEVHVYCPQQGDAESAAAVIDLATRGRKRGFCPILATQRLSKLHKDAAAECNNKLIGRTGLDLDMKRASDELGLVGRDEMHKLRTLEPGEFFAFGPAISPSVRRIRIGPVKTTHPKAGGRAAFAPPAPTATIRALLPQLADLPAEAEERQKTVVSLQSEVTHLKRQLARAESGVAKEVVTEKIVERVIEKPVVLPSEMARLERLVGEVGSQRETITQKWDRLQAGIDALLSEAKKINAVRVPLWSVVPASRPAPSKARSVTPSDTSITRPMQRVLNALAFLRGIGVEPAGKTQLALIAGVSPTSGGYFNTLGTLRSSGLVDYPSGGVVCLTDAGVAVAVTEGVPATTDELHAAVAAKLSTPQWKVLEQLIPLYPDAIAKDDLANLAGVSPTSGGYFNTLGSLRTLGLIDYPTRGMVAALPVLFLPGEQ